MMHLTALLGVATAGLAATVPASAVLPARGTRHRCPTPGSAPVACQARIAPTS